MAAGRDEGERSLQRTAFRDRKATPARRGASLAEYGEPMLKLIAAAFCRCC